MRAAQNDARGRLAEVDGGVVEVKE